MCSASTLPRTPRTTSHHVTCVPGAAGEQKAADSVGRKICFMGTSLTTYLEAAARNGTAPFDPADLVDPTQIHDMDPKDLLIITTGSQAEPQAMLGQAARGASPPPPAGPHTVPSPTTVRVSVKKNPTETRPRQKKPNVSVRCEPPAQPEYASARLRPSVSAHVRAKTPDERGGCDEQAHPSYWICVPRTCSYTRRR